MRGRRLARLLGTLAGAGVVAGWGYLWVARPWGDLGIATPVAVVVSAVFAGFGCAGAVAAARDVPVVLALAGLFGLVPVGGYFLLAGGPLAWIGWMDLLMLASGLVLLRGGGPEGGV